MNLFNLNESIINGYEAKALEILFILAILAGIFVITSKNPIISILYLIALFGSISIYLILLGLEFLALSYLIVYIGAVSILFLFILMLINIRISEIQNNTNNSLSLSVFIILLLYNAIFKILPYSLTNTYEYITFYNNINETMPIKWYSSNNWDNNLTEINHISVIGNILYSSHSVWLLIASFILLLAMVGTISITITNKNLYKKLVQW